MTFPEPEQVDETEFFDSDLCFVLMTGQD